MERVFQKSFNPSHYHTVVHTRSSLYFGEENAITTTELSPSCKNTKDRRLWWNPTCNAQSLESKRSLADSCASSDLAFWEYWKTGKLMIIPIHKKENRSGRTNCRDISRLRLLGRVYANCFQKCREAIESILEDTRCGFCLGRSTTDQNFTFKQIFEKPWKYV